MRTSLLTATLWVLLTLLPTATGHPLARAPRADTGIVGLASFYSSAFHGRRTASGIPFSSRDFVAAHPSLPFGTMLRVTNLRNGRTVDVRVVDRGPARGPRRAGVIIDLSRAAAERLGFVRSGKTPVRIVRLRSR